MKQLNQAQEQFILLGQKKWSASLRYLSSINVVH